MSILPRGALLLLAVVLAAACTDRGGGEDVPPAAEAADLMQVPETFRPEQAGFAVEVKDEVVPYRVLGLFVMPGETVEIEPVLSGQSRTYDVSAEGGTLRADGEETWAWTAPDEPGLYPLRVVEEETDAAIRLNAFVQVPFDHDHEALNGYRIGRYEREPLKGDPVYLPPDGFVEVTPENRDVLVAPHFTLGQFVCKQEADFPRYLVLRERLLLKLEMILEAVNDTGVEARTLHVMSGYRTPYYNESIGNRTTYSRHLYGGAADVFVDTDDDGTMDDLTGDGAVTTADARAMAALVETQMDEAWYQPFVGGLGVYSPAPPRRGPFIHVDVRGQAARW